MKRTIFIAAVILAAASLSAADGITDNQSSDIIYLLEEEKLARDVYTALGDKWNLGVFENIAGSEQTHMNRVADLAELYGLDFSILPQGDFLDNELQKLHDDLVISGLEGVREALEAGRAVEIMDIADLEGMLSGNPPDEIRTVLESLLRGSENHLAAFERQLSRM